MEAPALVVKLKGAQAAQLFGPGVSSLGSAPLQGATFFGKSAAGRGMDFEVAKLSKVNLAKAGVGAKAATARTVELEGARLITTKNGVVLHANKVIPGCEVTPAKVGATSAKSAVPGAAKSAVPGAAKSAVPGAAKAKAAAAAAKGAAAGSGTIWSGTGLGLGLGLGLGAWGPALLLGTAGLVAAGVYLYKRSQELEEDELDAEDGIRNAVFDE